MIGYHLPAALAAPMLKTLMYPDLDRMDVVAWALVLLFFIGSAAAFGGNLTQATLGACAIIVLMVLVAHGIGLIIGVLKQHPRMGELTGYITNGPEALVMIVGLIHGKLDVAMGVPLGSNFANPVLFTVAMLLTGYGLHLFRRGMLRTLMLFGVTATMAALFFQLDTTSDRWIWLGATLAISVMCYFLKGTESPQDSGHAEDDTPALPPLYLLPALGMLLGAGYFLDPAVSFTAQHSRVPEGTISFCVLSFITSWPEFRTALGLLKLKREAAAVMNIVVSNITNLWLAVLGMLLFLLL